MEIKKIAILGGGTAGWIAANHLGAQLSADPDCEITVIESENIPTIGVGEGTVPYITKGLQRFGISEAELLVSCDATFKQGIKFAQWLCPETHGDNFYYHPFDSPYPGGFDITPFWLTKAGERDFGDVGIQARIAEAGFAPKRISQPEYQGDLAYAYHFDAKKFADLLSRNAIKRFGVRQVNATIVDGRVDDDGNIQCLFDEQGNEHRFDFYVDCSGFHSVLLSKVLGVPFLDKSSQLFTDKALVQQVPLSGEQQLNPYTTATAHKAGWIWDIPLTTRRGTGFVYSSQDMNEQEALSLYADYLGISPDGFNPRRIDMAIGYREKFWQGNCVALGLAQGFVEPLEATSILVTDFCAELLARTIPASKQEVPPHRDYFNQVGCYVWERVIDFIKLHYCLSDRTDSDFWERNRDPETWSSELTSRLAKFKSIHPQQTDFFSQFDLFNEKNFLYVLYGMKYVTKVPPLLTQQLEQSESLMRNNTELVKKAPQFLLGHKEWLEKLKLHYEKEFGHG